MIREPHFHQFALAELLPFFEQFPTQYLSGERNIKLAYRHLVQPESTVRKLMILVNGRAENMLKWTELAYDRYPMQKFFSFYQKQGKKRPHFMLIKRNIFSHIPSAL